MKCLLDMTTNYVKSSDWKDLSIFKTCAISFGVLMGLAVKKNWKKTVGVICGIAFLATYIYIIIDFFYKACGCGEECEKF